MKSSIDRISYYLKKVNQETGFHPTKKRNPFRHQRLMNYKEAMIHTQIAKEHPESYENYTKSLNE